MSNNNVDAFALSLLEESKRFLEKAKSADPEDAPPFLHASIFLAFSSLEAHVNAMAEDFAAEFTELTVHEIGLLREKEVRLEDGQFVLSNTLKIVRLEDRIRFICTRFAKKKPVDFSESWWNKLNDAVRVRNDLTHPKGYVALKAEHVADAIEAVIGTLNAMYLGIYGSAFPAAGMRLDTHLTF
jgi:hypothetical protein